MSKPEAKIICDSISPEGIRLTTMEVKFHRFLLAEKNTHRSFSRNSASSRAIPIKKQLEFVVNDPAMPMFWGKNQPGMAASEELNDDEKHAAINIWLMARDSAVSSVEKLQNLNVHKQLANRLLEPFMWHMAIISSTDWSNFFGQRTAINPETNQPFAQPEIYYSGLAMKEAYDAGKPSQTYYGEWHLPFITTEDIDWAKKEAGHQGYEWRALISLLKKVSAGRCARVSYLTHDGKRDPLEDIKLADKLASAVPMHPSPFEHQATPVDSRTHAYGFHKGNFRGWKQYRHEFPNESI